jgi:hypothetical protein
MIIDLNQLRLYITALVLVIYIHAYRRGQPSRRRRELLPLAYVRYT